MRTQLNIARANVIRPLVAAGFGLALAFTFSCSSGNDNNDGGNDNPGAEISSSGGTFDSSSSAGVSSPRSSSSEISSSSRTGESSSSAEVSSSDSSSSWVSSSSGTGESSSSALPSSSSSCEPPVLIPSPGTPTGVVAQVNSTSSITLGWDAVSDATGYYIYRSGSLVGPYAWAGTSETTSYTDNILVADNTYYYRISAYNSGGEGSQSSYVSATTPPIAPVGVGAYYNSTTSIIIRWPSMDGADGYRVYRSAAASGTYELVGTATATSYENTGLTAGTTYYYKVAAYNSGGEGPQSSYVFATAIYYTITYNANGGTGEPASQTTQGVALTLSGSVPTRTGYVFNSWNTSADGSGTSYAPGAGYTGTDVTLYAQWAATYTVTYNANGGTIPPASQKKIQDVALTLSGSVTRTGYVFDSWNTSADGSGTSYAPGASYTDNASVTLYAQWTATYTIIYNANGGSGAPANQTKNHDVALTLSSSVPTRTYYTFAGWNTSADGSGTSYAPEASYTDNADVTLYAQWNATVTYNANGGTGAPASQTKTHNVALTLSNSVPTRTNYTFVDWNTSADGSGTSYTPGAGYTGTDVTLYAQWTCLSGIVNGPSVSYGDETYESVVICEQTWLKHNLNYAAEGSKCYGNSEDNCAIYGRLYDWATAMALPSECNSTSCASQIQPQHQGICPPGWHIPSHGEWGTFINSIGSSTAGTKLKATSAWISGNGTDEFGFSALLGGSGYSDGSFYLVGNYGNWWSASEYDSNYAYYRGMNYYDELVHYSSSDKSGLFSVRCVQD